MKLQIPIGSPLPMASRPSSFRAAVAASDWVAARAPRLGLRAIGQAGGVCNRLGLYGPAPAELRTLLPWLGAGEARKAAREIARRDVQQRAVDRLLIGGHSEHLPDLVDASGAGELQAMRDRGQGAVLLDVHFGPIGATGLALERLGLTALLIRFSRLGSRLPGFEVAHLEGHEDRRALALRRGLDWLRAGGFVAIAADGQLGAETEPVPCCGRLVTFRRGAFSLARLARVPIVPLLFAWRARGCAIEATACPPIFPGTGGSPLEQEARMARAVADWLDARVRARPESLSVWTVRWLQASIIAGESGQ